MFFFKKDFNLSDSPYANEPVAKRTSWKFINGNGTPTQGLKLIKINKNRLEFRISIFDKIFYMLFIFVGIYILSYSVEFFLSSAFQAVFLTFLVGIPFVFSGLHMLKRHSIPLVFDRNKRIYFEDYKNDEFKVSISFNEIYAVQLLSYHNSAHGDSHSALWCELNLVLNNGNRVYVCSYNGQYKKLKKYASKISEFIEKPIWDAL